MTAPAAPNRPDALGAVVAFALAAIYFALRPALVLGDPDIWWHVHIGRDIISRHAVPYVDSYSYTFDGAPWIAKEWLSQVVLGGAYAVGNWNGVMLVTVFSVAAALALLYGELSRHLNPILCGVVVFVAGASLTAVAIARPHIFTLPLLVLLTIQLFRAAAAEKAPPFWLLGLVVLWANLHGSFTLALVIAGFAFLDVLERNRLRDKPMLLRWVVFGILAALATLATPYGIGLYTINFDMMAGNETMPFITEWQPFSAQRDDLMGLCLLAAVAGLIAMRANPGWARILFVVFALNMFLLYVRFVYVFFLITPILVAAAAAAANPRITARADGRSELGRLVPTALALVVILAFVVLAALRPFEPADRRSIKDALAFVRDQKLEGPPVNGYNLGGVLMFNGYKTFLDGRTEQLFRGPFMEAYLDAGRPEGAEAMHRILDTYKANWTIFPRNDYHNVHIASAPGWSKAYQDDYVIIFTRGAPQ